MRAFLGGLFMGALAGCAVAGLAYWLQVEPWPQGAQLVGLVGGAVTLMWWTLAVVCAMWRAFTERLRRWGARGRRRQALRERRAYEPTPVFGHPGDDATVVLAKVKRRLRRRRAARAQVEEAKLAMDQGYFAEANQLLSEVIAARPTSAAHLARGQIHLHLGDFNAAMHDLMHAEDLAPVDPEPVFTMGNLYYQRKDYPRAIEHYDETLDLVPHHALARYHRGLCHLAMGADEAALYDLRVARDLDPDLPAIEAQIQRAKRRVSVIMAQREVKERERERVRAWRRGQLLDD